MGENPLNQSGSDFKKSRYSLSVSKSFLAVMALMIKCILYPGSSVFVVSGGKERLD